MSDAKTSEAPSHRPAPAGSSQPAPGGPGKPGAPSDETYVVDGVEYTVHPLAEMFPHLEGAEYKSFLADVKRQGVVLPVVRRGTQIIDGRTRVRAALEAGKRVPWVDLSHHQHPAAAIMSGNLERRTLNASQRAVFSKKLRDAAPEVFDPNPPVAAPKPPAAPSASGNGKAAPAAPAPPVPSAPTGSTPSPPSASGKGKAAPPAQRAAPASGGKPSASGKPPAPEPEAAASASSSSPPASPASSSPTPPAKPEVKEHERRRVAGEALGVSPTYQRQAEQLERDAPELFEAAGKGVVTVRDAYPIRKETPEVRAQALDALVKGKAKTLVAAVEAITRRAPKAQPPSQRRIPPKADQTGAGPALPPLPGLPGSAKPGPSGGPAPAGPTSGADRANPDMLTPVYLLAGLRLILGTISLDPCSNADAQDRIAAGDWFSSEQDGLKEKWTGVVWAFPPVSLAPDFAGKLLSELRSGSVERAGFLAPQDLIQDWARKLLEAPSFSALVVQSEPGVFDVAGSSSNARCPVPLAVYLFGVDAPPEKLASALGPWGPVLVGA